MHLPDPTPKLASAHEAKRERRSRSRARTAAIGFACANLLIFASTACGENPSTEPMLRGRGPLVGPFEELTACEVATYHGKDTALYSNRPYHTAGPVPRAEALAFCRGARHGTNVWLLDVARATTLVAFANSAFRLEERGWTPSDDALRVDAAGTPLDRLYTRAVEPGRYVIRQGFTRSAAIVLWDPTAARPASER
jgi:hypothetical protein